RHDISSDLDGISAYYATFVAESQGARGRPNPHIRQRTLWLVVLGGCLEVLGAASQDARWYLGR
ncbi:MAG: hypothetical protein Q7U96_06150, partial [Chloroflexota bacterium]|nr:hypothetical protein [Chloroflexota bacterium]